MSNVSSDKEYPLDHLKAILVNQINSFQDDNVHPNIIIVENEEATLTEKENAYITEDKINYLTNQKYHKLMLVKY